MQIATAKNYSVDAHRRSEEHTSELQAHLNLVCRLRREKKKTQLQSNANVLC